MRATVLASEYLVYVPALIIFLRHYGRSQGIGSTSSSIALVGILMQPATILVDHGHFQYNTVMLGAVVAALSSIYAGRLLWACIFFVAALGFKQMALYYSPVIFAYMLGTCLTPHLRPTRLLAISLVTAVSFAALLAPLAVGVLYDLHRNTPLGDVETPPLFQTLNYQPDPNATLGRLLLETSQMIHRCFPFARGLFEDKVANFWCALNTVYKLRRLELMMSLPRLSSLCTLIFILPSALIIGAVPRRSLLPYALASCSWAFFLFSFQVHEKSVLLPLLPTTLLLASSRGLSREYRAWIGWANILGAWTLYPLLRRDELRTPYVVITLLWAYLMGLPPTSISCYHDPADTNEPGKPRPPDDLHTVTKILHVQYYVIMAFWHLLAAFAEPPDDKPDLWVVVNCCFGAIGFGSCYLWCTWKLIAESGILDEFFGHRNSSQTGVPTETSGKKDQ